MKRKRTIKRLPVSSTKKFLREHIEDLSKKIGKLIAEKEEAEKALEAISPKIRRPIRYNKDTTLKQKAIYCLRKERKILGINGMLEILYDVDPSLKEDEINTKKSLRLAVFRMVKNGELTQFKMKDIKTIHYALNSWVDSENNVKEKYIYDD